MFYVLIPTVLVGIGWWAYFITTNILATKQQLADGGNKQIVAELKNPRSPEQLRANLSTVIAQIQTDRLRKEQPNVEKVRALSSALSVVIKQSPYLDEGWQTAAELISYRSAPVATKDSKPCVAADQFAISSHN